MRWLFCASVLLAAAPLLRAADAAATSAKDKFEQLVAVCAAENNTPPERAVEVCSALLQHEPARPHAWDYLRLLRGIAYADMQMYDAAIADFDVVLSAAPTDWNTLALRAFAHANDDNVAQGVADIERSVALQPKDAAVHYLAGFIHELNNDVPASIASFSRMLVLDPTSRDALFARGALYERNGQGEKALADYSAMVALDPNDLLARHSRGALYAKLGRGKEARTDFAAAAHIESRTATSERSSAATPSLDGEVYARPCKLPDGSYAPAAWVKRDAARPQTFDYYESQTDPETGFCTKEILAKHPNATRENASARQAKQQDEARRRNDEHKRALEKWDAVDGLGTGTYASDRSVADARRSGSTGATPPGFAAPARAVDETPTTYGSTQPLKPPQYIPYEPRAVTSTSEPRRRTLSPDRLDTRYNPYETVDEARHGRGRRYDPYATRDSWEYDRSNPYAVAPAYKYRGIYNPFSGSATPYNPPTTLGGGYEPNNWQTNRYNPFGTPRSNPMISGDRRAPLTPLNPPSNCPNKSTSPLNPYATRSC